MRAAQRCGLEAVCSEAGSPNHWPGNPGVRDCAQHLSAGDSWARRLPLQRQYRCPFGWLAFGTLSLVLCPQVQNTPLQRAAHAHGITTSWFMPYGCKLSSSTSTCGSFAYPRKTTWQTCRPVPSFSSSWTWEACGAIQPLLMFILVALVTTRSPARLSDRRRCALHHYSSGSSLFSHAAQLQERFSSQAISRVSAPYRHGSAHSAFVPM